MEERSVSVTKYHPDHLNMPLKKKKRFLVDGIVRRRLTTPNVILAVLRG